MEFLPPYLYILILIKAIALFMIWRKYEYKLVSGSYEKDYG